MYLTIYIYNIFTPDRWLTKEIGVAAIPVSAFYEPDKKYLAENLIRLCFCKIDTTLDEACIRLQKLKPFIKTSSSSV